MPLRRGTLNFSRITYFFFSHTTSPTGDVERMNKREFSLDDVYAFEAYLQAKHPLNNNVKAKIRQQLQYLRDKNILDFVGRGQYRMKIQS